MDRLQRRVTRRHRRARRLEVPFHLQAIRAFKLGSDVAFERPAAPLAEWPLNEPHLGPATAANVALRRSRPRPAAKLADLRIEQPQPDRKSTRLNSSHRCISYA